MMSDAPAPELAPLHDKGDLQKAHGHCHRHTGLTPVSFQHAMSLELLNLCRTPETRCVSGPGGTQCGAGASQLAVSAAWSSDASPRLPSTAGLSSVTAA